MTPNRRRPLARRAHSFSAALLVVAASAGASEPHGHASARALYEACGMPPRVVSTAALVNAGLASQRGQVPDEVLDEIEARVRDVYAPSVLESAVLANLERSRPSPYLEVALQWCASLLGRKVATAETAAIGIEVALEIQRFAEGFEKDPPARDRMLLESRFESATKSTELRVALATATAIAIATAFDASLPEPRRSGPEAIRSRIAASSAEMEEVLRPVAAVEFLFTYRDLSAGEIARYIEFLESDAGRWLQLTRNGAYLAAMLTASNALAVGG